MSTSLTGSRSGQVSLTRRSESLTGSGQVSGYEPAARKGVECRLGSYIIKIAFLTLPYVLRHGVHVLARS